MYGLDARELRFALLVSSSHFAQHVYYRLLPPLIPVLAVALEYPLWQLGLLITVYSLGMGLAQAPLGVIADRMDRIYLLPSGIGITALAYILFAVAPILGQGIPAVTVLGYRFEGGFLVMCVSMVIVGVGLAVVHPAGYPMISDNISVTNKGKVLGLFGASSKFGDAVTPAIIAALILVISWESIILLFGIAGIVYSIALFLALGSDVYETRPAVNREEEPSQSSVNILSGDRRTYLYPFIAMYVFFIGTSWTSRGITTFFPAFVVSVYAFSFDAFGIHIGPESVANVFFAVLLVAGGLVQLILGGMADRYDPRQLLIACMAVATVGMVALALVDLPPIALGVVVLVLGVGLFGVNPPRDAILSDMSPPEYEGRTFGYIFTLVTLTGALFPTIIGYVLEVVGMREGFLLLAAGTIIAAGAIALLYSENVYRRDAYPDTTVEAD